MLSDSSGVNIAPGLTLWPVSFGTLMALNKLGNPMVSEFVNGRNLEVSDFTAIAEFFWAHTRPWLQVQKALTQYIATGKREHIDAEILELSGSLLPGTVELMMRRLLSMQKEARNAQVEIIPDKRHTDTDAPKN